MNGSREFVEEFFEQLSLELKGKTDQAGGVDIFIAVPHILIPLVCGGSQAIPMCRDNRCPKCLSRRTWCIHGRDKVII